MPDFQRLIRLSVKHALDGYGEGAAVLGEGAASAQQCVFGSAQNASTAPPLAKTETYQSPSGNFQVHFYQNEQTGELYYGLDY
jgi:hypothetical protein